MKKILIFVLVVSSIMFSANLNEKYQPTRKEWLEIRLQSALSGWNEFGYVINITDDTVMYNIYYDENTQSKQKATLRAKRLEESVIKYFLKQYDWAKDMKVVVNVYRENK